MHCELTKEEMVRRKELSDKTRKMICEWMTIAAEDETSVMTIYRDFYLQISFSELHPLMVFGLAKPVTGDPDVMKIRSNEMNLRSVLGCHSVNESIGCYNYRATHWLETQLDKDRLFEILNRCADDAIRGYYMITR